MRLLSMGWRLSALACAGMLSLWAQNLKLPAIFSDHLVLQAGKGTPVFGKADPGAVVAVTFTPEKGEALKASATAGRDGKWLARLPKLAEGEKGVLTVTSGTQTLTFSDALVGEVWLCSGQSNMQWSIGSATMTDAIKQAAADEAAKADGKIRLFRVKSVGADTLQDDVVRAVDAGWEVLAPANVKFCTAVGWNFAVGVFQKTGFPVGLISSSWGGTPVEAWLPKAALDATSAAPAVWKAHEEALQGWEPKLKAYNESLPAFYKKYPEVRDQYAHRAERLKQPYYPEHNNVPVRLYNAMIHGLEPYGVRGVLWYQGETNGDKIPGAYSYGELIQAMVKSWRAGFGQDFWFYYVELANFKAPQKDPVEPESWGVIRDQQAKVLALPRTGVATAIDAGKADDVHPTDKKTVGDRLAGMALNDLYGQKSLCRSPEYVSSKVQGGKVIVQLANADGLRSRTEKIGGFAIAGADGNWVWADSVKILPGGVLEVSSSQVEAPVAVRYAWASNPVLSLENSAGLPLRPFGTDAQK